MPFSKSFPRTIPGSNYPLWEEVSLSSAEEKEADLKCKFDNVRIFGECLDDAKKILQNANLSQDQSYLISVAASLFDKRASHSVFYKEAKAKEKFDQAATENSPLFSNK